MELQFRVGRCREALAEAFDPGLVAAGKKQMAEVLVVACGVVQVVAAERNQEEGVGTYQGKEAVGTHVLLLEVVVYV